MEAMAQAAVPIDLVVADRRCAGLEKAKRLGLPTLLLERRDFSKRFDYAAHSQQLVRELQQRGITKLAMAGWMTLLGPPMFQDSSYAGRILNTHPSLLPQFPGAQAVRQALAAGVAESGCTIHVVTPDLDAGPIVAQQTVPVRSGDTEASLHERIKEAERELYPKIVHQWLAGELQISGLKS
jgi:formyltetrahydrofolate-dependent phosphoribosylglycinamide formyltransferase